MSIYLEITKRLPKDGRLDGVEVGVWAGDTSACLLAVKPNIHLYCVDKWEEVDSESDYGKTRDFITNLDQGTMETAFSFAKRRLSAFSDRAAIIREDSVKASQRFGDESLDFVFIDGDHSESGCYRDLVAWWPKVKDGGLFCGHDYNQENPTFGIDEALERLMKERAISSRRLDAGGDHTWFIVKSNKQEPE